MMIQWILTTSTYYNSLEKKEPNALYFLEDTQEIYRGTTEYTSSVIFVDDVPALAAKGKVYVNNKTNECTVWNGQEWKTVVPEIHSTLDDDEEYNGLVTGEAVKEYVAKKVAEIVAGGNVELNADNVITTREIVIKGQTLGSYKDGDTIPVGETLMNILSKQFAKQIPPTYEAPTYSINPGNGAYEAGESISFNVSGSFVQKDAGPLTKYTLNKIVNGHSEEVKNTTTIETYREENLTVLDGGTIKFTGRVTYEDGEIKNDNLGVPYPTGQIKGDSLSQTFTITGQRKVFYGKDKETDPCEDSDDVRALPQNALNPANGTKLSIAIKTGDTRVTFAYPATLKDVQSVISTALNLDVKGTFNKETLEVEGANGFDAIQYKVYTYIPAIPFASDDTYTVTI